MENKRVANIKICGIILMILKKTFMQANQNDNLNVNANQETISELAHRHLLDPNHETTDEELRTVRIEFVDGKIDEKKRLDKEEELRGERSDESSKDDDIVTSYDVLKD